MENGLVHRLPGRGWRRGRRLAFTSTGDLLSFLWCKPTVPDAPERLVGEPLLVLTGLEAQGRLGLRVGDAQRLRCLFDLPGTAGKLLDRSPFDPSNCPTLSGSLDAVAEVSDLVGKPGMKGRFVV